MKYATVAKFKLFHQLNTLRMAWRDPENAGKGSPWWDLMFVYTDFKNCRIRQQMDWKIQVAFISKTTCCDYDGSVRERPYMRRNGPRRLLLFSALTSHGA